MLSPQNTDEINKSIIEINYAVANLKAEKESIQGMLKAKNMEVESLRKRIIILDKQLQKIK